MKWESTVSFFNDNTPELKKEAVAAFQCSRGFVVSHHHRTCSITFCSRIIGIYPKWEWGKEMTSMYKSSSSYICWLGVWIQKFQTIIHHLKLTLSYYSGLYRICEKRCTIIITRMITALAIFKVLLR